jgi:hypothetical protein
MVKQDQRWRTGPHGWSCVLELAACLSLKQTVGAGERVTHLMTPRMTTILHCRIVALRQRHFSKFMDLFLHTHTQHNNKSRFCAYYYKVVHVGFLHLQS